MAVQLAPLFSLEKQFVAKDGALNTAGWLKVFLAATDDPAETFADYYGTPNPEKIILDDNGRAVVICDKAKAYRLEVYDADGMLLWTEEPVYCSGTGGGGVSVTTVESTDGSIAVESSVVGSNRIYDLSIAPDNAKELLEWVKTDNEAVSDGPVRPVYVEGTMDVYSGQGIEVSDAGLYHVTVNLDVIPSGNGINYETLSVFLMLDDGSDTPVTLCQHDFDVDNSLSDKVELEFAYDLTGKGDGKLYLVVSGATPFQNVDVSLQMHRVYSGIAAVPKSIASKAWVEQNISSKIDYSALEYNQQNLITGISGSAIAANNVDPNEFVPWSASGVFQPSGDYLTASASSLFQPSGSYVSSTDMSAYVPFSSIEGVSGQVTAINQSAIRGHEYEGVYPIGVDNTADKISIDTLGFGIDNVTLTATSDENGVVIGVANNLYQPSGDYLSATESSKFQLTADMSAYQLSGDYAYNSSVSAKLDTSAYATASGNFLTAVPAGYATEAYVDSAVSGKLDTSAYDSAQFLLTSQSSLFQLSGQYLSATESANYYPSSNPSGFISGVDLSPYQLTADMSAYQLSGNYQTAGSYLSSTDSAEFLLTSQSGMFQPSGEYQPSGNYLSATESSNYYPSSNPSGFIDSAYVEGQVSGKQDASAMTAYQPVGDYQPSGDYIQESALGWVEV